VTESGVDVLERWQESGALWRVVHLSERLAVVELLTCHGEPVDRIRSTDARLISWLGCDADSDDGGD
jgi:hypothetical protein